MLPLHFSTAEEKHYHEIIKLLKDVQARCYSIGTWLKLTPSQLEAIRKESPDYATGMEKVISNWLKRNYNTDMHGPPTWEMLVEAVRAPTGGNNKALAEKIAKAASNVSIHVNKKCWNNVVVRTLEELLAVRGVKCMQIRTLYVPLVR